MQLSILFLTVLGAVSTVSAQAAQPDRVGGGRFGGGRFGGGGGKGRGKGDFGGGLEAGATIGGIVFPPNSPIYCNRGWGGDGNCEKQKKYTFCCSPTKGGEFAHSKNDASNANLGGCLGGAGAILCAS